MEPTTRIVVDVTFLDMHHPPRRPVPVLPEGWWIEQQFDLSVAEYRAIHGRVGHDYCWWMRQVRSDTDLAHILADPCRSIFLLKERDEPRGFFELEIKAPRTVNLAYFGLFPENIGRGIGRAFLHAVVALAWSAEPRRLTVNTCTADHPRALPNYLAAGFRIIGVVREEWNIPDRLGMPIPERLRA
ncbi:GNAT family N-acetyltransferase [Acetobacter estunensis]|uniref:GNAT family N-acetyltransferase n=1 Tax=Acetobacter estunensis TaxID=104097 RepID=UPI001C2DC122|nr:GNAT family N-acetyltransferase [Acetobacter estunensis]MBV1837676.1 GNAT family N-acetyltransferase [Acetobacter estunensis]